MDEIARLKCKVKRLEREVQELNIDPVTGIAGRRVLDREMRRQFARSCRFGRSVGILMIDIDNFKRFNDDHGHPAGDKVLRAVAQVLQSEVRGTDMVGRYGGEELVVCVDQAQNVSAFAERLRKVVERLVVEGLPKVTVSIGCAESAADDDTAEDTLKRADVALYRAKGAGRNRVSS